MSLTVTERAAVALKDSLARQDADPEHVIRLALDSQGKISLVWDVIKEGDHTVDHHGTEVMVVDPTVRRSLSELTFDVKETSEEEQSFTVFTTPTG